MAEAAALWSVVQATASENCISRSSSLTNQLDRWRPHPCERPGCTPTKPGPDIGELFG